MRTVTDRDPARARQTIASAWRRLRTRDLFSAVVIFVAVAAPAPYGSIGVGSYIVWSLLLGSALIATRHQLPDRSNFRIIVAVLAMIAVYEAIGLAQALAWMGIYAPAPVWAETSRLLGGSVADTASVDPDRTIEALGTPLLYGMALLAGALLGARQGQSSNLRRSIAAAAVVYALYAILVYVAAPHRVLLMQKELHLDSLTGTFFNRNTEAAFVGATIVVALADLITRLQDDRGRSYFDLKGFVFPRWFIWRTCRLVLLLCTLFLTHSRAGVYLTFLSIVGSVIFFAYRQNRRRVPRVKLRTSWIWSAVALLVTTLVFELSGSGLEERLRDSGLSDAERWGVYLGTFKLIAAHPFGGIGIGTFELFFPAFRTPDTSILGVWQKAHSTVLEIAVEAGLPYALCVYAAWAFIVWRLVRRSFRDKTNTISFVAGVVLAQAGLHSLFDYPLQIPGFGLFVAILVGAGLGRAELKTAAMPRREKRSSSARTRPDRIDAAAGTAPIRAESHWPSQT